METGWFKEKDSCKYDGRNQQDVKKQDGFHNKIFNELQSI